MRNLCPNRFSVVASRMIFGILVTIMAGSAESHAGDRRTGFALSVDCVGCHGNDGISDDGDLPNLAG